MTDEDRFAAFEPDHRQLRVNALLRQVEAERRARIRTEFPIERQLEIIAAALVERSPDLTTDERRIAGNDASSVKCLMRCIARHRLAAESLSKAITAPGADLTKINPASPEWWKV